MIQPLFVLLIAFLLPATGQAVASRDCVHVLIPAGMPIKINVHKDESESEIQKYVIDRTVSSDVRRAKITTVMLDNNGMIKFKRSREGDHLSDPMSIATADTSVARILLIVEWLETDKGKWVLDTKFDSLDIPLLAKLGAKALPKAIFVSK